MSLNSVQSFVIDNCNGPSIENSLNNVCLHTLSRTFTFNVHGTELSGNHIARNAGLYRFDRYFSGLSVSSTEKYYCVGSTIVKKHRSGGEPLATLRPI